MAAVNYFIPMKRGDNFNPFNVTLTTSSVGASADVEIRIQINDGSNATGITRKDVILLLEKAEQLLANGAFAGANLPAL